MEALVFFKILLFIIVAIASLVSYISYKGRRRDSARALSSLRQQAAPLRRLTVEERETLTPFLHEPNKPDNALTLDSDDVFLLEGEYRRHGISDGGNETWHDLIAGVEVVLPFDARLFLAEHSRAEVVFAGKMAIAVRLNDEFELLAGGEREKRRQVMDEQWNAGAKGALQEIFLPRDGNADPESEVPEAGDSARRVEVRGQRNETPGEIEARQGRGVGLLAGLLWLLGFAALWLAVDRQTDGWRLFWLGAGGLLILLALRQFWRPWRPGRPQKVNIVSGVLNLHPHTLHHEQNIVLADVTLGDKLTFQLPEHWRPHTTLQHGQRTEMEMRVEDYSVVRYGDRLSLDQEYRRFPPVYWGRHLSLAIVGVIALVVAVSVSKNPRADLALAWGWISGTQPLEADSAEALLANLPSVGQPVSLSGRGRCQVQPPSSGLDRPAVRCDLIRWGGSVPKAGNAEVDPVTEQLYSRDLVQTHTRPVRNKHQKLLAAYLGNHRTKTAPLQITNFGELAALADKACGPEYDDRRSRYACDNIRQRLLDSLPRHESPADWNSLRRLIEEHKGERPLTGTMSMNDRNTLRRHLRTLAEERARKETRRISQEIIATEQGGALIEILGADPRSERPDRSYPGLWHQLAALTGPDGETPFAATGIVVARGTDNTGTPWIAVDTSRQLAQAWPAVTRALWVLLAAALLLIHGVMAVRSKAAQRHRLAALDKLYGWK